MDTIAAWIAHLSARLMCTTDTPRLEAELLLSRALGVSRAALLARLRDSVDASAVMPLLERRLNHEPLAYIFGEWEFFGLPFFVCPPLLTPRPETEHLVETALDRLSHIDRAMPRIADVCCGTGCVAVSVARHASRAFVYACDLRSDAVRVTRRNASRHGVSVACAQADLLGAIDCAGAAFDLVLANPPYVPEGEWAALSPVITKHEDRGALVGGPDGLALIRRLVPQARACLRPGGLLALEIGDGQYNAVAALLTAHGFVCLNCVHDLAGAKRVISGICP